MRVSIVLSLLCFAIQLTGCSGVSSAPVVTVKDVPQSLQAAESVPAKPDMNTGDNTRDFKNISVFVAKLYNALGNANGKLEAIRSIQSQGGASYAIDTPE